LGRLKIHRRMRKRDRAVLVVASLEASFSDWYISFMGRRRKSPQEKKQLEYAKDHFTFGWNSSRLFPRAWSRKKAHVNRQFRHKSEELLGKAKPGIANDDVELIADDWTAEHFKQSVSRKRLYKHGTVTQGEKIKRKLEERKEGIGRTVRQRRWYDREASSAMNTLDSLKGKQLIEVVRLANLLCCGNAKERKRVVLPGNPAGRAIRFAWLVSSGSASHVNALRRDPELSKAWDIWRAKAQEILERDEQREERRRQQKEHAKESKRANSRRIAKT